MYAASILALVAIQSVSGIAIKASQRGDAYAYDPLSAQCVAEAVKLGVAVAATRLGPQRAYPWRVRLSRRQILNNAGLAAAYCFINEACFRVLERLDPATVSVFKSGGSIASGVLAWALAGERISRIQWTSIFMQTLGLVVVRHKDCSTTEQRKEAARDLAAFAGMPPEALLLGSVVLAALAGLANQVALRDPELKDMSMMVPNAYQYLAGVACNCGAYAALGGSAATFFRGYDAGTGLVIACQATVGLGIAFVLRHADNVARTFASACAVAIQYFAYDVAWLRWRPSLLYASGCGIVFASCFLWIEGRTRDAAADAAPPLADAGDEGGGIYDARAVEGGRETDSHKV